jgi:hypothetical protein
VLFGASSQSAKLRGCAKQQAPTVCALAETVRMR